MISDSKGTGDAKEIKHEAKKSSYLCVPRNSSSQEGLNMFRLPTGSLKKKLEIGADNDSQFKNVHDKGLAKEDKKMKQETSPVHKTKTVKKTSDNMDINSLKSQESKSAITSSHFIESRSQTLNINPWSTFVDMHRKSSKGYLKNSASKESSTSYETALEVLMKNKHKNNAEIIRQPDANFEAITSDTMALRARRKSSSSINNERSLSKSPSRIDINACDKVKDIKEVTKAINADKKNPVDFDNTCIASKSKKSPDNLCSKPPVSVRPSHKLTNASQENKKVQVDDSFPRNQMELGNLIPKLNREQSLLDFKKSLASTKPLNLESVLRNVRSRQSLTQLKQNSCETADSLKTSKSANDIDGQIMNPSSGGLAGWLPSQLERALGSKLFEKDISETEEIRNDISKTNKVVTKKRYVPKSELVINVGNKEIRHGKSLKNSSIPTSAGTFKTRVAEDKTKSVPNYLPKCDLKISQGSSDRLDHAQAKRKINKQNSYKKKEDSRNVPVRQDGLSNCLL